ncbi:hypothetical protein FS749_012216 [Ceratobasidium sp. UAMH 11750]|nr:hypothetical protein FS749_012216 [Ceratobasidium sp. UAMH 11750]
MFRNALATGVFAMMQDAWKKKQEQNWDKRKEKKNRVGHRSGRKTTQLNAQKFGFLADPSFQSSKESDPDDKKHCIVQVPAFRLSEAKKLIGALDVKYNVMKTRPGNPTFTQINYHLVNVAVPALKKLKHQRVPGWVVHKKWAKRNPDLERSSCLYIDSCETEMPQAELVELFVHDHEPNPRAYLNGSANSDAKSDISSAPAPVSIPVELDTPAAPAPDAPAPNAPSTDAPAPDAPSTAAPTPDAPTSAALCTGSQKCKSTEKGTELKERKKKKKENQAPREPKSKKEMIKGASTDAGSHVQDPAPGTSKPADTGNVKSVKLHVQGS